MPRTPQRPLDVRPLDVLRRSGRLWFNLTYLATSPNLRRPPICVPQFRDWRSQFVTSKADRMGLRHAPMAFTEQGVAMLSSVLNSERAIAVNIAIMRAFVQLREFVASHENLARKLAKIERKYDAQFKDVFEVIRQLMPPPGKPRRSIGFPGG